MSTNSTLNLKALLQKDVKYLINAFHTDYMLKQYHLHMLS